MGTRHTISAVVVAATAFACLPIATAQAAGDPWCTATSGFNPRKMGYDAYVKAKGAALGATLTGATVSYAIDATNAPATTAIYLGKFSDRSLPAPDYWAYDKGQVTLKLTKDKAPSGWLNKLGATTNAELALYCMREGLLDA